MRIRGQFVRFESTGATIGGYLAAPAEADTTPGLVLVPDVRGLSPHFERVAERFAAAGFATLALDPYAREGAPELADMGAVDAWMRELPDTRVLADIAAARSWLGEREGVDATRIGVTGFCMGGKYALLAACCDPRFAACVVWYGMLRVAPNDANNPNSPIDTASRLSCPLLGLFGAEDALIPADDLEALRSVLERNGKDFELEIYEGAGHAFFNDTRTEMYRPATAERAWTRAVGFLHDRLGPPQSS